MILKSGHVAYVRAGEELRPFEREPLAPAELELFVRNTMPPGLCSIDATTRALLAEGQCDKVQSLLETGFESTDCCVSTAIHAVFGK